MKPVRAHASMLSDTNETEEEEGRVWWRRRALGSDKLSFNPSSSLSTGSSEQQPIKYEFSQRFVEAVFSSYRHSLETAIQFTLPTWTWFISTTDGGNKQRIRVDCACLITLRRLPLTNLSAHYVMWFVQALRLGGQTRWSGSCSSCSSAALVSFH